MDIRSFLKKCIDDAIQLSIKKGNLEAVSSLPKIKLEVPPQKEFGDFSTNFAMQAGRIFKKAPKVIAKEIIDNIEKKWLLKVEIAGPGFLNFFLKNECYQYFLGNIGKQIQKFGSLDIGKGKRVQIEFVSANPTGPLHVGHGRGAVFGSVLANILNAVGFVVEKEFYVNNTGKQIENLTKSIWSRYLEFLGLENNMPEDGYFGEDIKETALKLKEKYGTALQELTNEECFALVRDFAIEDKLFYIKQDLIKLGVTMDSWFKESKLHEDEEVRNVCLALKENGNAYEKEGALWFCSSKFGDEKDRVLIRENKLTTYITADIAYHLNKYKRDFDLMINIWGADHHGYIARMKAAITALGKNPDLLEIILLQMVHLYRDGKVFKMSKRTGESFTISELIDEVGRDAVRYFFILRSGDSQLDFDIDLALEQSNNNPVYYIQYACARIASVFRLAKETSVYLENELCETETSVDLSGLVHESEIALIKCLNEFRTLLRQAAEEKAPHHLARFAYDLASAFHSFYNQCRVLGVEADLQKARLFLIKVTQLVLKNVLKLLGINAPDKM